MDTFVVPFAKSLVENGYEVTYICNMNEEFKQRNGGYAKCIHLSMRRGFHFFDMFKFTAELKKIFKQGKFDVVYYATDNASFYSCLAGKAAKVPVRLYAQWGIHYVAANGFERVVMKILEKIICKNSTHIRAVSPKNRQFALDERLCSADKIKVLGLGGTIGVDFTRYNYSKKETYCKMIRLRYGINEDDFVFGFVGRVTEEKGCTELLKAFKTGDFPDNAKLMMVGMYDGCEGELLEFIDWAKDSNKIIFTGFVQGIEVCKYMAAMDILVHPTYREGFGMVLQEALAMGVPIITTDVPGPSEVIEENVCGWLVPTQNTEILQEKMIALMNDTKTRKQFAEEGRKRVKTYFERSVMINNILVDMDEITNQNNDEGV